jgi:threonylcarbamoyladenosine tRNA methylthiotransferase MtaB
MPQVARAIVKERARRLREKGAAALAQRLAGEVGARQQVLVESGGVGRTGQFMPVRLAANAVPGTIVDVTIVGHDGRQLLA